MMASAVRTAGCKCAVWRSDELEDVLEEWVLFRVSRNLPLPMDEWLRL